MTNDAAGNTPHFLSRESFSELINQLRQAGYRVIAPVVDQGAITYGPIESIEDLPRGWTDEQGPGRYRLKRQSDEDELFGYVVGPHSWKQFLFPPRATVSKAEKTEEGWEFSVPEESPPRYAFLGVRACDLAAIAVQDRIFLNDAYVDPAYRARREQALIIAVNCTTAAATCFCTSMGTGPRCESGFDLGLTELESGFVVEIGSERGRELLDGLTTRPAGEDELKSGQAARQRAVDEIEKTMDTTDIKELLMSNLDHPRWDDVAQRCLSCTNCTMVCPTCFCSSVTEVTDLQGENVERQREWDSCFNPNFSYIVGGKVRDDIRSRYRQWLTHKLATWIDQFGTSGCIGCGRCITWCPVGIDLTEEVAAIRNTPQ